MNIRINGKEEKIEGEKTLLAIIDQKGLVPERVVIEHNLAIVPREKWASVILKENDKIEIVSFVGGG